MAVRRAAASSMVLAIGGADGKGRGLANQPERPPVPLWMKIVGGLVFLLFIGFVVTHPSLAWLMLLNIGSGRRGGGWDGGGFGGGGGGGFSGGGGRSGGGGASGSW